MAEPTRRELQIEVEALRKQNADLTNALLEFFTKGGLRFRVEWAHQSRDEQFNKLAGDRLVAQAVTAIEQRLGDRAKLHRQNSVLRSYANLLDCNYYSQLHEELYGNPDQAG